MQEYVIIQLLAHWTWFSVLTATIPLHVWETIQHQIIRSIF
jgi:hypothetical protein